LFVGRCCYYSVLLSTANKVARHLQFHWALECSTQGPPPVYTSSHSSVCCLCLRLLLIFKLDFTLAPKNCAHFPLLE